jgi:two-component system invasion response regulator UvrY
MEYIHGKSIISIAIADDHTMLTQSLSSEINRFENCKVILQAGNGKELIEKIDPENLPELILIDLAMPEINGVDTIKILKKKFPNIKFLAISMYPSEFMIQRVLEAGGHGFLEKNYGVDILKHAIYEIMQSRYFFTDRTAARMARQLGEIKKNHTTNNELNNEEISFIKLNESGKTYKEIAKEMKVKKRHIEQLQHNLFQKLDVRSRTELAVKAIKMGITI